MSPPKLKQLLLARCLSLQGRGDRQACPYLVVGSGSDEIAGQAPGKTLRALIPSIGCSSSENHG